MIRAGSLTYAVFVSTVTAVLCMMMIMLASMNRNFFIYTDSFDRVRDNAESGIMLGLAMPVLGSYENWHELFEPGSDSVRLKKRKWGLYELIYSEAVIGKASFSRTAISGYTSPELSTTALWLADRNRPLQLAGEALLKGIFFLPEKGVDRAYVEGTNYSRDQLLYGTSKRSDNHLPELEKDFLQDWESYLKGNVLPGDSTRSLEDLPQSLAHSFGKRTVVYQQQAPVQLDGYNLKGNIIIRSNTAITVSASTQLEQVVLIAPKVTIGRNFKGSLHALASDSLRVLENAKLEYPSSLIMKLEKPDRGPHLFMDKDSEVFGAILSLSDENRRTNELAVEIVDEALVKGMVYANGNLELGGTVQGTLIARNFMLATPSGIYENHLLNGKIDRTELEKEYLGIPVKPWDNKTEICTWLPW
ncbi:MAG TPA: hypothetical protein DDW81_15305 [Cryomorphaceae bacterium]|nr:hypothetical protein [Cryomorphaceae bacterium]